MGDSPSEEKDNSGYLVLYDQMYYDPVDPDPFTDPKLWTLDGAVELDLACSKVTKTYKVENYSTCKDGGTIIVDLVDPENGKKTELLSPNRLGNSAENGTATVDGEEIFLRIRMGDEEYFPILKKIEKVLGIKFYSEEEYYEHEQLSRKYRTGI